MTTNTLNAGPADIESAYEDALANVDEMLEQSRVDGEAAYRQIVFDVAEGRLVDPAKLRNALIDASRTKEELKRHVGMVNERRRALADRERAEVLAATLPELRTACETTNAALKEKEREYRAAIEPMQLASRTAAEDFANADVTVKTLRMDAANVLNRTVGPEFTKGFQPLSNRASSFAARIRDAELDVRRAKVELPEVEAKIAILEGQVMREEAGGLNEVLIAQIRQQIDKLMGEHSRLSSGSFRVEQLKAEQKAAKDALDDYTRAGVDDFKNINWSNDRPAWSAASER